MDEIYNFITKHYNNQIDQLQLYDLINHAASDRKETIPLKLKKKASPISPFITTGGDESAQITVFTY